MSIIVITTANYRIIILVNSLFIFSWFKEFEENLTPSVFKLTFPWTFVLLRIKLIQKNSFLVTCSVFFYRKIIQPASRSNRSIFILHICTTKRLIYFSINKEEEEDKGFYQDNFDNCARIIAYFKTIFRFLLLNCIVVKYNKQHCTLVWQYIHRRVSYKFTTVQLNCN